MKNIKNPKGYNCDKEACQHQEDLPSFINRNIEALKIHCEKCFGLCCVALYFSASEGFPTNKEAGSPCINLQSDFRCSVHKDLRKRGLKGCTAYDCFGAGEKVSTLTYGGRDWLHYPESSQEMFNVFLIMRQLHEMLWYLVEALRLQPTTEIEQQLISMIIATEKFTFLNANDIMALDIIEHRVKVNALLRQTSEFIRNKIHRGGKAPTIGRKTIAGRLDFIGKDLRKANLRGADFRGAFLIAADLRGTDLSGADFIGADLRDADLRGANLTKSAFLTQAQINAAKGDVYTKLPKSLTSPDYWEK